MIMLNWKTPQSIADIYEQVQTAIDLEFSTLPPYLYAKFSILPDRNAAAQARLEAIIHQEMIHMGLACNIMNALGGAPKINPPHYPGPLPGDVDGGLVVQLLPFSIEAMKQGMAIETPDKPIKPNERLAAAGQERVTIGEFYRRLDDALSLLPAGDWIRGRNQIGDAQFFLGQLFPVGAYAEASAAIHRIVSEGEGTPVTADNQGSPLDFQNELAHYYRFWEMERNQVLAKDTAPPGYRWGAPLGVDWDAVYPAIANPELHDFSHDPPAARAAQEACDTAYTTMVDTLAGAVNGAPGGLGVTVRPMFDLRMAAIAALHAPLADGHSVAGPAFRYLGGAGASSQGDAP
jgi:Ferritin-like